MTNEAKMSLEEKIVQRLKDDTLMMAVGDEDMLTDLVKRAINEALFQRQKVKEQGWNGRTYEKDSLVVEVAKEVVRPVCESIAKGMVEKVLLDADVKAAINDAMPRLIFDAMKLNAEAVVNRLVEQSSWEAQSRVLEAIKTNAI